MLLCGVTASARDTATLTITPDVTQVVSDGSATKITYIVTVTPPAGEEIGVFSFRLKPSGDMKLPTSFQENGQTSIQYIDNGLEYVVSTGDGVFHTYEYSPDSNFFAAVGSDAGNRMTKEAQVLKIVATVPAGSTGVYALDADFTVAPDGSGTTYIGKVNTTPVLVTDASGNTSGSAVIVTDLDEPVAGEKPDTEATVTTGGKAESSTSWLKDGETTTDATFESGHVYTSVTRVKTEDTNFDSTVYTNAGYTVERISDTEVELRRSYYVEDGYTQALTEKEAQQFSAGGESQTPASEQMEEAQNEQQKDGSTAEKTMPKLGSGFEISTGLVIIGAVVLAAVAVVIVVCTKRSTGKKLNGKRENQGGEER